MAKCTLENGLIVTEQIPVVAVDLHSLARSCSRNVTMAKSMTLNSNNTILYAKFLVGVGVVHAIAITIAVVLIEQQFRRLHSRYRFSIARFKSTNTSRPRESNLASASKRWLAYLSARLISLLTNSTNEIDLKR